MLMRMRMRMKMKNGELQKSSLSKQRQFEGKIVMRMIL